MKNPKAALRYAKSLLDLSIERKELEVVHKDFNLVLKTVEASRELRVLLSSPVVSHDKKHTILTAVFGGKVGEIVTSFLSVLTRKNRESLLVEVVEAFNSLYLTHKGIQPAKVTSSVALDAESLSKVEELAKKISGMEVMMDQQVNEDLIGGFLLRVGDFQVDASIAGKLKAVKNNFDENQYVADF